MHFDLPMFYGIVMAVLSVISLAAGLAAVWGWHKERDWFALYMVLVGLTLAVSFGFMAYIAIFAERPNG